MYNYSLSHAAKEQSGSLHKSGDTLQKEKDKNQEDLERVFEERTEILLVRLFQYFTDMGKTRLKFKNFISKYSILMKSEEELLSNIIYFINTSTKTKEEALLSSETDPVMGKEEYERFITQ